MSNMMEQLSISNSFSKKIDLFHLGSIAQILVNNKGWTYQQAERAIADYIRYLLLTEQNLNQVFVPTKEIDAVLHEHISLSAEFAEDCKRLFGHILHHEPGFGNGDTANRQAWLMTFRQTKQLFKQLFGIELTDDPAHCFTLSSGSLS